MEIRFCFRLTAEAGWARDTETGEPAECYTQVKLGGAKNLPENYEAMHKSLCGAVAAQIGVNPEYVIPISQEEYDENVDPEEEL
ncbi:hypothetical protein QNH46_07760 [Paenibacillus woosongensis]|uniref:Uncharacterized protein n=1 Tax=Paenibacillus woosongensis TaxID=307580 RepID=A0AA95IA12_9BACL|nr:hypothetical protein [Paenibacillus woosongensis]WHX50533.1 hypothetical protein QNH46_07760 [Paenibacillus woosongensis]